MEEDKRDFTAFYAAARDDCLRIVVVNVGDRDLAEDLVAEGFTRAWMSWRKVREHPAPRAWVVRTALNAHVSWWRRRRREVALEGHDRAVSAQGPGEYAGLDDPLATALRRLPLRQREVLTLRLLLDLDTETTARTLGISAGTVGAHLHRALEALRAGLDPPPRQPPLMHVASRGGNRGAAYVPDLSGVST